MEKALVSIITPLYNAELYISRTIDSILSQTYSNWELIVIDDKSTDKGIEVVKKYIEKDSRIKLLYNEVNSGAAVSRNKGIEAARGSYIAFLDSDDQWHKDKLSKQLKFMQENKYPFTYTFYNHINEKGEEISRTVNLPLKINYKRSLKANDIGCLTAMYDVEFFGKQYMANIRKRQDYTLWLKLLKITDYAYCLPEVLATYTIREGSISSNKYSLLKYHWRIYRHIEKQSFLKASYTMIHYLLYHFYSKIKN